MKILNSDFCRDETVMMPENSEAARNAQKAALAGVSYEKKVNPKVGEALDILAKHKKDVDAWATAYDKAVIRDAARDYALHTRKTKDMAMRSAELEGRGYSTWAKARKDNDWNAFKPVLQEIVALKQEVAHATRPHMSSYDANIDEYERGMTSARITMLFAKLKSDLNPLISSILESKEKKQYSVPSALQGGDAWSIEKQKELCLEIAHAIGFDFTRGRFDVSVHPFTGGPHPTDVRITTRYSTENWLEGIAGTVHEVGHGLYEQGRNEEYVDLPVSRSLSMGVHESQSLFWERMVFQSYEFWQWATPLVHKHFPHTKHCTADDFYRYVNQVHPGFIRVDADEVTYPIHIMLRFEMEKAIFSGRPIDELPRIWNDTMKKSLNLIVPDYRKGILQDVHWAMGAFGYFPSYTLGAMIAAQLFEQAEKDMPDLRDKIRNGKFVEIKNYLNEKIHKKGSLHCSLDELLMDVTGKPLDPQIYVKYLEKKYRALYKLT